MAEEAKREREIKPRKPIRTNFPMMGDSIDKPIPRIYSVIDTDLARDNLENDITAADLQDL